MIRLTIGLCILSMVMSIEILFHILWLAFVVATLWIIMGLIHFFEEKRKKSGLYFEHTKLKSLRIGESFISLDSNAAPDELVIKKNLVNDEIIAFIKNKIPSTAG